MAGVIPGRNDKLAAAGAGAGATANVAVAPAARSGFWAFLTGPWPTLVSRLALGFIFALAGLTKLGVPATFTASIQSYEMPLPDFLVQAMAYALPALELGLGIWLLIGLFTRFSAAVSGGLLIIFLVALIQATLRGLSPDCGCFVGAQGNPVGLAVVNALGPLGTFLTTEQAGVGAVIRDLVFLLMAVDLWFVPTIFAVDQLRSRGQDEEYADEDGAVAE